MADSTYTSEPTAYTAQEEPLYGKGGGGGGRERGREESEARQF